MSQVLTVRTVKTIKPGPSRKEIPDRHLPGLYFIVQPSGARSWAVRYRNGRLNRKFTLGGFPIIDLKTARELAGRALRAVAEGRDPGREKVQARELHPDTVEAVARQFIELHCRRVNRSRTIAATQQMLDQHVLPRWRNRLLRDIKRRDVLDLLDGVVESGRPVAANRLFTTVRKMFNWAMARDIIVASPCAGVRAPTLEQSRDRVLTDAELRDVWSAADKLGGPYGALVKLLLLTGQRRDEVARLTWSEVALDARLWALPRERAKNNRAHEVPLSDPVLAILAALPRIGEFVLTTTGRSASSNFCVNKRKLDALLPEVMPWRLHDLRRTMASGMARLGVNLPVIEKVLNHTSGSFGGIVGVYQRHDFGDEKRRALEVWGEHVIALVEGRREPRPSGQVIELQARA